jgi:hypothetical protein
VSLLSVLSSNAVGHGLLGWHLFEAFCIVGYVVFFGYVVCGKQPEYFVSIERDDSVYAG